MDYSEIYTSKRINDLEREIGTLHSITQHLSIRLAQLEKKEPKPMTAREAYDDALYAIAKIMAEPLTGLILGKKEGIFATVEDIIGEIKARRDRNTEK